MTPEISIIVPIYKVEAYIHKCVNSILNQTFKNFELILVEDGSPDKCGEICDEYAKKDSRVVVIHKQNGGVSSARNIGLKKAVGKYISFVDPDDYLELNYYDELLKISKDNELDIAVCQIRTINYSTGEQYIGNIFDGVAVNKKDIESKLIPGILRGKSYGIMSSVNKIYKKDIFYKFSICFDENRTHGEDARLNLMLLMNIDRIGFLQKPMYNYQVFIRHSLTQIFNINLYQFIKDNMLFGSKLCDIYNVNDAKKHIKDEFRVNTINFIQSIANSTLSFKEKYKEIASIIDDEEFKNNIQQYDPPSNYYNILKKLIIRRKIYTLIIFTNIKNKINYLRKV